MTVTKIRLKEEVDNRPDRLDRYGELEQGDTYENLHVYELVNDDGTSQFLAIAVEHDSYGRSDGLGSVRLVTAQQETVMVWK